MIKQLRLGFATNSSSSHSVIIVPDGVAVSTRMAGAGPLSFGWENFVLADEQSKRDYFCASTWRYWESTNLAQEYLDIVQPSEDPRTLGEYDVYVDHESAGTVGGAHGDLESLKRDLESYLDRRIVVLGGNDNTPHNFGIQGIPFYHMDEILVPEGRILFNRQTGDKVHLLDIPFKDYRTDVPELVDIKLTDYCDQGCKFCYQDSTKKGQHGDRDFILTVIDELAEAGTFEIAFGGGEPASHPDFLEILKVCRERGIVPNFTTRNYNYIFTEEYYTHRRLCGSIGISAATLEDVNTVIEKAQCDNYHLQVVMGAQSKDEFYAMLDALEAHRDWDDVPYAEGLILLGYKMVGRGPRTANSRWYEDIGSNLIERLRKSGIRVSIDTELARQIQAQLGSVPPELYALSEGQVSCYVDAVNHTMAPSSYCEKHWYRPYNLSGFRQMSEEFLGDRPAV